MKHLPLIAVGTVVAATLLAHGAFIVVVALMTSLEED